jgi:hypothetical protein
MNSKQEEAPNWRELALYSLLATGLTVVNASLTTLLWF